MGHGSRACAALVHKSVDDYVRLGSYACRSLEEHVFDAGQLGKRELTVDWADIGWSVHLANRKAAWYQWQIAMDIPEAATTVLRRRNAKVAERGTLVIDAGEQRIAGRNAASVTCVGEYTGVPVKLGELLIDAAGQLLVLGGHGVSASPTGTPIYNPAHENSFINADG